MKSRTPILLLGFLLVVAAGGLWLAIGGTQRSNDGAVPSGDRPAGSSLQAIDLVPDGSAPPADRSAIVSQAHAPASIEPVASEATRGTLSGRLLLPDGTPAADVATALFADTHVEGRKPLAETRTAADGTFTLAADAAPILLVAVADGVPPLALSTQVVAGADTRLPDAAFVVGAHIRGTWRVLGRPVPRGSTLTAVLFQSSGARLELDDRRLVESGGDVVERIHDTTTDDTGRFRLEGLEPGLYRVNLEPEGIGNRLVQRPIEVRASIDDWIIDFDDARIILGIELDGVPVAADVSVTEGTDRSGSEWVFGGTSTVDVLVPPSSLYGFEVKREGCRTFTGEFTAPSPGQTLEQTISLLRESGLAELVVDVVTDSGSPVRHAGIALFRDGDHALGMGSHRRRADGREPTTIRDLSSEDGSYRLTELLPGRYEVRVVPESSWDEGTGFWRHDPAVVDLPVDGRERKTIVLREGGRMRFRALDDQGASLPARCHLVGPAGEKLPIGFWTRGAHGVWSSTGSLQTGAPEGWNLTSEPFAPGTYEVRFYMQGRRDVTRVFEVAAGGTCDVEVVLARL